MKLKVIDKSGADAGEVDVQFPLIEDNKGSQAVHDVVVAYRAAQRSGTACAKTRAEVAGSGKKPWRQKGTGRARAGSVRSPIWRGGGVVFGPRPRSYRKNTPKAVKQLAFRRAVSERLRAGDVTVVSDLNLDSHRTRDFAAVLGKLDLKGSTLIVSSAPEKNLALAARNIPNVALETSEVVNTYQILRFDHLVFTKDAFEIVSKRLSA